MPPYTSPEKGSHFTSKFVRIGETIITTEPDDIKTRHNDLARAEGILDRLTSETERKGKDADADAGQYTVFGKRILISAVSHNLDLPLSSQARDKSVTVFQAQSEGFEVEQL